MNYITIQVGTFHQHPKHPKRFSPIRWVKPEPLNPPSPPPPPLRTFFAPGGTVRPAAHRGGPVRPPRALRGVSRRAGGRAGRLRRVSLPIHPRDRDPHVPRWRAGGWRAGFVAFEEEKYGGRSNQTVGSWVGGGGLWVLMKERQKHTEPRNPQIVQAVRQTFQSCRGQVVMSKLVPTTFRSPD